MAESKKDLCGNLGDRFQKINTCWNCRQNTLYLNYLLGLFLLALCFFPDRDPRSVLVICRESEWGYLDLNTSHLFSDCVTRNS